MNTNGNHSIYLKSINTINSLYTEIMETKRILDFVDYVQRLKGSEKSEGQIFFQHLFQAFGHEDIFKSNGLLEANLKFIDKVRFADCLWLHKNRDGVLFELKSRKETNLRKHIIKAKEYWDDMNPVKIMGESGYQKPKYVVLCNFDTFIIYDFLLSSSQEIDEIRLIDLPLRYSALNFLSPTDKKPLFGNNSSDISIEITKSLGNLYRRLSQAYPEEVVQRFLLQCVLCMFAEDFDLLPENIFTNLITESIENPEYSYNLIGELFKQMGTKERATGGRYRDIQYFNGGLFSDVHPINLDKEALKLLQEASKQNWLKVNPSIFGSFFESTLLTKARHELGAHYTYEIDIYKIIEPCILKPWKEKISRTDTFSGLKNLLTELGEYKVLDPACGCGNFLFVAYRSLKEIELLLVKKLYEKFPTQAKSMSLNVSVVNVNKMYGIDIQPIAVDITKLILMISKEIMSRTWNLHMSEGLGLTPENPLPLDNLDQNIICEDALFIDWPKFDVVIGNPPFQSKNKMKEELGENYVKKLRSNNHFKEVNGRADYCVYWFYKTHKLLADGQYAGLVGTNTIRQNYSRESGLDHIVKDGTIIDAVSSQEWSGEANVFVSIVNWIKGNYKGVKILAFETDKQLAFFEMNEINSSLSLNIDVSMAETLAANSKSKTCFQGQTHGNKNFLLEFQEALRLYSEDEKYKDVVFPYLLSKNMLAKKQFQPKTYIVDLQLESEFEIQKYEKIYNKIVRTVYPEAKQKADSEFDKTNLDHGPRQSYLNHWYKLWRPRQNLIEKINTLRRYCVCSRVTKRNIFEFVSSNIHPNDSVVVFAFEDDYSFGILQSDFHWDWFNARCSTLTERYRYTSNTVYDTFPWPQNPSLNDVKDISNYAKKLRDERKKTMLKNNWSYRELYREIEILPKNSISILQDKLNKAVKKAYGCNQKDRLAFLIDLNQALYEAEQKGEHITGPGLPEYITDKKQFITDDCIKIVEQE